MATQGGGIAGLFAGGSPPAAEHLLPFAAGETGMLARRVRRLEILCDTAARLIEGKDPDHEVLPSLFSTLSAELGVDAAFAYAVDELGGGLRLTFHFGIDETSVRDCASIGFGENICGKVAETRLALNIANLQNSEKPRDFLARRAGIRAYAVEPLLVEDRLLGILSFASRSRDRFDEADLQFFHLLADQVALARAQAARLRVLAGSNRELNHRVKNMLTVVQAIASVSARTADGLDSFVQAFGERIEALGKTQALLGAGTAKGAGLRELLCAELSPFEEKGRVTIEGVQVGIPPSLAVPLGMAIHELTTNAVKYGALSSSGGQLDVRWWLGDPERSRLLISWAERGGPPVPRNPRRRGFGSKLLDRLPGRKIKVQRAFEPGGLRATIEVLLD